MTRRLPADPVDGRELDHAALATKASRDARGVPPELLDGYVALLAKVSLGRRHDQHDVLRRREIGTRAAEQGLPLRGVIDLYLSATWLAWPSLPGVRTATAADALRQIGTAVVRAADRTVIAIVEGYEEAQRWSLRQEESFRREFVDDLLEGRNLETLAERAERYGLRLAGDQVVMAIAAAKPFVDGGPTVRRLESAMRLGPERKDTLVTTKDGRLVCVTPEERGWVDEIVNRIAAALEPDTSWRAGIGRPHRGPGGAVRSFEQATAALDIGRRLQLPGPVYLASDLLVYQVLIRDSAALADLVDVVLEPLRAARSGPGALLDTLAAYFASGRVATIAARELHVGVRTVTYRLDRVKTLSGYSVHDPGQAFTLQVAVLGARLLGWPSSP